MLRPAVVSLLALLLFAKGSGGQVLWCQHDPETTPFHEARTHLGAVSTISADQMDRLAEDFLDKMNCATTGPGYCDCFPASAMQRLLDMETSDGFDEEHFNKASVMLLETARDMVDYCPKIANESSGLTYGTFEHTLTECPGCHAPHALAEGTPKRTLEENVKTQDDHGHHHDFSWTLLDQYSHLLNHSYTPVTGCAATFTAESVFRSLPLEGHGVILESEVPIMSAALVMRYTKGDCLHHSHWHVERDDFIDSLFKHYANESTCLIYEEGLDLLITSLSVGGVDDHDDHDDHPHEHGTVATRGLLYDFWTWGSDNRVGITEDDHDHDHGHDDVPINASVNCYSTELLLEAFDIDIVAGISRAQLEEISAALLQQAAVGCQTTAEETERTDQLTTAQIYGYGTLAVLVETLCAVVGLVIVKWRKSPAYKYILMTMLGLSVGTMVGDAILHLIPKVLGLHSHDGTGHDHSHDGVVVEDYTWKMFVMMWAVWLFFMMQLGMEAIAARKDENENSVTELQFREKSDAVGIENYAYSGDMAEKAPNGTAPNGTAPNGTAPNGAAPAIKKKGHGHSHLPDDNDISGNGEEMALTSSAVPWMILFGDGLHNFADGMAIGAAFSAGWRIGLSTTIAVFCHELPHEFGDIAAVLSAGWSPLKALGVNMGAALCAFAGLYIGIPLSTNLDAEEWILALAGGMFIYISLANIVPEMVEFFRAYNKTYMFIASNCGFGLGFLIMMLIAIFEEQISI